MNSLILIKMYVLLWVVVSKYIYWSVPLYLVILASMFIATGIKNLDFHTANRAIGAAGFNIKKYISISMY